MALLQVTEIYQSVHLSQFCLFSYTSIRCHLNRFLYIPLSVLQRPQSFRARVSHLQFESWFTWKISKFALVHARNIQANFSFFPKVLVWFTCSFSQTRGLLVSPCISPPNSLADHYRGSSLWEKPFSVTPNVENALRDVVVLLTVFLAPTKANHCQKSVKYLSEKPFLWRKCYSGLLYIKTNCNWLLLINTTKN